MCYRSTEIRSRVMEAYVPRTPLGWKLLSLRKKAVEKGMRLLSVDEILEELRKRRGEIEDATNCSRGV